VTPGEGEIVGEYDEMKKILLAIVLATAFATPVLATPQWAPCDYYHPWVSDNCA
jgi:hypothetical protein